MKKLINRPEDFVREMLDGLVKAHPDLLAFADEPAAIVRADAPVRRVRGTTPAAIRASAGKGAR